MGLCAIRAHFLHLLQNPHFLVFTVFVVLACALNRHGKTNDSSNESATVGSGSYTRYSSDNQDERSIADQQRKCSSRALQDGSPIVPTLQFVDEAVSGATHSRAGFDEMMAAARAGFLRHLYLESLSRLARDCILTLSTLRELVYGHKVRITAIDDGIDTDLTPNWELLAAIFGVQNEQYLKTLAHQSFRGQEGIVLDGYCVGDYCFGFTSEPIPGTERRDRSGEPKPLLRYIIDTIEAEWVRKIFYWFVHERRALGWIVKKLNKMNAPKDHRSTKPHWRIQYLSGEHGLLRNRKYIGVWPWGENQNVRDPLTGKKRQEKRSAAESAKWTRHFSELRIIDDETFFRAQELLAENVERNGKPRRGDGKLNGSSPRAADAQPRHLLAGLIVCGQCGRRMNVGGANGQYLFCPGYALGDCSCKTQLRRDLAESMILDAIAQQLRENPDWTNMLLERAVASFDRLQSELPSDLRATQETLKNADIRLDNLFRNCEDVVVPELQARITQIRSERDSLRAKVARLEREADRTKEVPTLDWIQKSFNDLQSVLVDGTPAAALALRALVNGAIVVHEVRQPGRKRFFLKGEIELKLTSVISSIDVASESSLLNQSDWCTRITLEFREPPMYERLADDIKKLWDEGRAVLQIAEQLDCSRIVVSQGLEHWHSVHGIDRPDGRSCRKRLKGHRKADVQLDERACKKSCVS